VTASAILKEKWNDGIVGVRGGRDYTNLFSTFRAMIPTLQYSNIPMILGNPAGWSIG
jgi:hypothetical protein